MHAEIDHGSMLAVGYCASTVALNGMPGMGKGSTTLEGCKLGSCAGALGILAALQVFSPTKRQALPQLSHTHKPGAHSMALQACFYSHRLTHGKCHALT